MQLKTKRIVMIMLFAGVGCLHTYSYAANELSCTQSVTSFSNCTEKQVYLYQDNNQNQLPDYSFVPKTNYIYDINPAQAYNLIQLMPGSNVEYYTSTGNMLYTKDSDGNFGTMDNTLFKLQSWAFPYKTPIRAMSAFRFVNIEIPSTTGLLNPVIGLKYNYVLKKAIGYDGTSASSYRYRPVPSLDYFSEEGVIKSVVQDSKKRSRSPTFATSVCVNYNVQRCGDSKLATHTGYTLKNKFTPTSWVSTGFTPEVCDSTNESGAACINGTAGCCNTTCSGFGGGFCGDGIVQEELNEMCDLGPWNPETQQGNISDYKLSACAAYCEANPEPETLPEELG